MNRKGLLAALLACALLTAGTASLLRAADAKPKYTIKDVMKALHKGEQNMAKKVSSGQGTKDDFTKLVEYYESLPLNTPAKGDKASWAAKSTALVKAARSLNASEPNALAAFKQAVNCKACHSAHKPD